MSINTTKETDEVTTSRRQRTVYIDEDVWRILKTHCVRNKWNVLDKGGEIIKEWVQENCKSPPAD